MNPIFKNKINTLSLIGESNQVTTDFYPSNENLKGDYLEIPIKVYVGLFKVNIGEHYTTIVRITKADGFSLPEFHQVLTWPKELIEQVKANMHPGQDENKTNLRSALDITLNFNKMMFDSKKEIDFCMNFIFLDKDGANLDSAFTYFTIHTVDLMSPKPNLGEQHD